MDLASNKENVAPPTSSDPLARKGLSMSPSPKKTGRRGRSKSIGPGSLEEPEPPKRESKDRRKSAFIPTTATKSILSKDEAEAKAARRKSMMNRRVSFAPEATLHTWDIMEHAHDQTTSTDSAESTRRGSAFRGSSSSPGQSSDADDAQFASSAQDAEDEELMASPVVQGRVSKRNARRSSGIPPMNFNNPEDFSSSGVSGSEDSGEDDEEEEEDDDIESGDETGTAMSLDVDDHTIQSASDQSTSSSTRIELALQQAAKTAGTRGIAYDEFGDMSMEIAGEEVTNALKPWMQQNASEPHGSASLDQENINPFSPAFKAEIASRPATIAEEEEEEEDMSMDVTRAVGGIMRGPPAAPMSSPAGEGTMDFTQAIGKITGQKRRASTTESGSPGESMAKSQPKRMRTSIARSSMGDDTMDLTLAVGGIQSVASPPKPERRRSTRNRRSSGVVSNEEDATMEFTRAVGGIQAARRNEDDSIVGNEELSMELTTVLGGIRAGQQPPNDVSKPRTPEQPQSPARMAANTTPKEQERFRDTPDLSAKKLLTPIFQKESEQSAESQAFVSKPRLGRTPSASVDATAPPAHSLEESVRHMSATGDENQRTPTLGSSPAKAISYPELPPSAQKASPIRTPSLSPQRRQSQRLSTNKNRVQPQSQSHIPQDSPTAEKQMRSSPWKETAAATPEKRTSGNDSQNLTNTIKLMSTPRKETLKNATPKKHTPAKQMSPVRAVTPRGRPTPKGRQQTNASPVRRLKEDLERLQASGNDVQEVGLQDFLTQAGIRFMDLTTTKRRMTTAPTPSRARASNSQAGDESEGSTLESLVVAAARTVPELELYQHACHELKRYTKEGKQMISELESATLQEQPPLIRAYVNAGPDRKAALDTQMRDMKTSARLQSKEMWYAWRSKLLDELMVGLQSIGEGLIKDDESLSRAEEMIDQMLPKLVEQHDGLRQEAERLEETVNAVSEEEKEELEAVREELVGNNAQVAAKRLLLEKLQRQSEEQDSISEKLHASNAEFTAATKEANRVRDSCRGVSLNEITALKESVKNLEESFGWSITSASSSPSTLTMSYKGELQLFFHPQAFAQEHELPNAPIRLNYIADSPASYKKKPLTTTLRFFLQLLQATLQGIPQCTTKLCDLLSLVSKGWDTAAALAESERRLNVEALTESRIVGDERLAVEATVLLPKVRTKVRATFEVTAMVGADLEVRTHVQPRVVVVYGEQYNEKNMGEFLKSIVGNGCDGWDSAVRGMREKLIARGVKGARK